jgi:hypothetical protein
MAAPCEAKPPRPWVDDPAAFATTVGWFLGSRGYPFGIKGVVGRLATGARQAAALLAGAVSSGACAVSGGSVAGSTNVLPLGPASTA